jgi:hypothetical protein
MASAHIFTVDPTTFNTHLSYMFAGTGAGREEEGQVEQKGALADILGVRAGDDVLFYVAGRGFYGFFKAKQSGNSVVFYEAPENQYLNEDLGGKTLTYRLFIGPSSYGVYRSGVEEWDAIESPENIEDKSVLKMQWSWIFKKLKGGRGCTAIPKQEFDLLRRIISANNEKLKEAPCYKFVDGEILPLDGRLEYRGATTISPVLSGDPKKIKQEVDLRILFSWKAGVDESLNEILKPEEFGAIAYISNESKCSFGMRSMDLLFLTDKNKCLLIELKNDFVCNDTIVEQMSGYARWLSSYKPFLEEIIPILVIREPKLYPKGGFGWKFKYLSKKDCHDNKVSPWYQNIVNDLQKLKSKLEKHKIERLSELRIYQFHTSSNDILQSFTSIG